MKNMLLKEVDKHFRPEFINRLDDVIVFKALTKIDLKKVVEIEMERVIARVKERDLTVVLEPDAADYLIEQGYNPDFGARPLKRTIEKLIEDPLSEQILREEYKGFNMVKIKVKDSHLYFEACRTNDEPMMCKTTEEKDNSA
jgi:ATP-dependent Clp protease ATP-binding subunit ClpC